MAEAQKTPPGAGKGKAFFDRGDQVAETGNWDFAIQMYLEGIRREPDDLERGHEPLRKVSLTRKAQGGKGVGFLEGIKRRSGKDPLENLVNAEYFLAKEPGKVGHMVAILKAAQALELPALHNWIGELILEVMRQAKRPSKQILLFLAESLGEMNGYALAVQAMDMALKISPNDGKMQAMAKNFSAQATIQQGKYDTEGSFTEGVVDMEGQLDLVRRDSLSQSRTFLEKEIDQARAEYEASPDAAGKVDGLVDALLKIEEEAYESEAVDVLAKAHRDSGAYRFKQRIDDVKIRQIRRRYNKLRSDGDKKQATEAARELLAFELKSYAERAANYPTDMTVKFELGRRQLTAGKIDDAIASLQQAQRNPKRRVPALNYLSQAFAKKEWHSEAVDTCKKALDFEPPEELRKEILYNMGLSLKAMGDMAEALAHFSEVAQMDYNFRDVRDQIEQLRKQGE